MKPKILVVDCTSEKLHFPEFVQPVLDAIQGSGSAKKSSKSGFDYSVVHRSKLTERQAMNAQALILTGTSLADNAYLKNISKFNFLKNYEKPVLGICAGMHIIANVFGAKIEKRKSAEIGNIKVEISKDDSLFAGMGNEFIAYALHNNSTTLPKNFILLASSQQCKVQAFRHKSKPIYGVEFHPEVGSKKVLVNWLGIAKSE